MTNEELVLEVKRLEEQIKDLKIKLEEKAEKKPYEVEVPEDLENYFYVDETGIIYKLSVYVASEQIKILNRGLAFKTKEEAEQFDKERILINKFKDWAKKYNEGWTPDWKDFNDVKYYLTYDNEEETFDVNWNMCYRQFTKLPYFKSEEIVKQFIDEFRGEIEEVFC